MNLQSERIASACEQLGLHTTASCWPELAKKHLEQEGTYGDFIEALHYRLAESWNMEVVDVYKDEAISRTSTNRPAYQKMLADAQAGKFSVLLLDDLSRLGHDVANNMTALNQLKYSGIQVRSVEEQYDSMNQNAMSDMTPIMKGMFDQIYIKDLAHKTRRGLEGQFERGYSTGGSVYGYKTIPVYDESNLSKKSKATSYRLEIVESEANIVKQIFEWYADGFTPRNIAQKLNAMNIPSPSGKLWAASTIQPHIKRNTGLLLQSMYNGLKSWNRTHSVKNTITGKRKQIQNPPSEWQFLEDETLRIVSAELWNKVQARIKEIASKNTNITNGIKNSTSGRPGGSLFSGILKCHECGGNLIINGRNHLVCSTAKNKGACTKKTYYKRNEIEKRLVDFLDDILKTPENIELYKNTVLKMLNSPTDTQALLKETKNKAIVVKNKIDYLIEALADGAKFETVKPKMEIYEQQLKSLEEQIELLNSDSESLGIIIEDFEKVFSDTILALTDCKDELPKARELVSRLVSGEILINETKKASEYEASFEVDPVNMIKDSSCQKIMVAGTGFEPMTFGL